MGNIFDRGMAQLRARLGGTPTAPGAVAVTIVYHRGVDSVTITNAWTGRTMFRTMTSAGVVKVEWSEVDFMIPADALVFGGAQVEPADDDWIEQTHPAPGDGLKQYRASAPMGEQTWRYCDGQRTLIRLHAKSFVPDLS